MDKDALGFIYYKLYEFQTEEEKCKYLLSLLPVEINPIIFLDNLMLRLQKAKEYLKEDGEEYQQNKSW